MIDPLMWPVRVVFFALLGVLSIPHSMAQNDAPRKNGPNGGYDSLYVKDYTHILTTRLYTSSKTNSFTFTDNNTGGELVYRPNNRVNLGIGASYRAFTLNLGIGFKFLNKDDGAKGSTEYFDAQGNMFGRKWVTNLFFQTYKGYYIDGWSKDSLGWDVPTEVPYRGDIRQSNFGFSTLHVFNNERFSYRAAFNQDAWQRKSAGSWLLGGYATYYDVSSDSSLVPSVLSERFDTTLQFKSGAFFDVGIMGGYAHTFVVSRHWFLTGSAALGFGPTFYSKELDTPENGGTDDRRGGGLHGQGRVAFGRNGPSTCIAISYNVENVTYALGDSEDFGWNVGNFRVNLAHRFGVRVKTVDKVFDNIGL
jgi:hypothetical protein